MSRIRADRYTNREGTGAPTFSEGVNVVGVTSMSGDLAVTNGTITGPSQLTISGITSSISDTAVDVFVYDTSKDSDGGAWRKRTQNTSWYNETLNTTTRGSRKEFPAVAVIVAETTKVTIYDGDDPDLPMWMVFTVSNTTWFKFVSSGPHCSCISALNGTLCAGGNGAGIRLAVVNFIKDNQYLTEAGYTYYNNGIETRNDTTSFSSDGGSKSIVNNVVNDVAMTVLPNAPIDSATGLPIPTIAVATAGGVSVIKDDGTVVDLNIANRPYSSVDFATDNLIFAVENPGTVNYDLLRYFQIPSADITTASSYGPASSPALFPTNTKGNIFDSFTYGSPVGLSIIDHADGTSLATSGMIAYLTSNYNTGWMQGDIKGAFLSDTDTTNVTGGTQPDRSINNNALTVNGTITKTAVATGAELVAFSGFSASNYLEQAYNSDMEFGTGDFYMMAWIKSSDNTSNQKIITRDLNATSRCQFYTSGNLVQIYTQSSAGFSYLASTTEFNQDVWLCYLVGRSGGTLQMYVNGKSESGTGSNTSVSRDISFGAGTNLEIGRSNTATTNYFRGSIALARVGAGFPSPEQVKKMYEDEKVLFQENAKATLYGSSDAVTALAYDDTTDLLHVGTSAGRSEFQGLRRINNTTTAVTTALSASNELVAEQ